MTLPAPLNRFHLPPGLALLPLLLMVSLPFLHSHHRNPIPSFFAEWWAVMFGLVAGFFLLQRPYRENFALPPVVLLPATLAALILVQLSLKLSGNTDAALLATLYLLWTMLLMGIVCACQAVHGKAAVSDALATGLVLGSLVSVLVVAIQLSGLARSVIGVSVPISSRLYGNLNQPNHLALQLWLGIAALIYLHARHRIRSSLAFCGLSALVIASLFTGSRALWLYAGGLTVLAALLHTRLAREGSMLTGAVLALLIAIAGKTLLAMLGDDFGLNPTGPTGWISPGSDGLRAGVWWMAFQMGIENPVSGIGWGAFSGASYMRIDHFQSIAPRNLVLFPAENAHNIFLHLFAELGALAPLSLLALSLGWLFRVWRPIIELPVALALSLLTMLGLHAQLEYTLWYAFFLGIAATFLAVADPGRWRLPALKTAPLALVLAAAVAVLFLLRQDYSRLERAMSWPLVEPGQTPQSWDSVMQELVDLRQRSQFGAYVNLAMVSAMPLDRAALGDKLTVCQQALAFSPTHYAVFKCAALQALAGHEEIAKKQMALALAAYPEHIENAAAGFDALKKEHPELAPLADLARSKVRRSLP